MEQLHLAGVTLEWGGTLRLINKRWVFVVARTLLLQFLTFLVWLCRNYVLLNIGFDLILYVIENEPFSKVDDWSICKKKGNFLQFSFKTSTNLRLIDKKTVYIQRPYI